ncbi:MAG: carbohydrate ABC transporter permease [Thermomicrobiales bacterium]
MATQAAIPGPSALPATRRITPKSPKIKWGSVLRHVILAVFALIIILPLVWVLLLSVKSLPDAYQNEIWPKTFDWSHYWYSLQKIPTLPQNYMNSIVVTLGTVVITTVCAILAGYAMVFLQVPGIRIVFALLVASMFFPTRVTAVIAIFETQKDLGLLNVPAGLIFPYVTLSLALSVFVMRGMFQTVPREIYDAARIDGAGPVRMLLTILLPMVKNGIVVVIIVNFVTAWGEYLLAKTLNTNQSAQTLPVVLSTATGGMGAWVWPRLAAVYIMAILPGLLAFAFAQRWYIKGLQEGALKA